MQALEARIPPPLVGIITGLLMWLSNSVIASVGLPVGNPLAMAGMLVVLGLACAISGVISFRIGKTTVNPLRPDTSSNLIISGIYKVTRNPMYVGMALVLAAWAVYLANLILLLWVVGFIGFITQFQIKPEERALDKLFGAEFANYKQSVRRWI